MSVWATRSARRITSVFGDAMAEPSFNVAVARVRCFQGEPGETARYDSGEVYCTDPGIADGRVTVKPFAESALADGFASILR